MNSRTPILLVVACLVALVVGYVLFRPVESEPIRPLASPTSATTPADAAEPSAPSMPNEEATLPITPGDDEPTRGAAPPVASFVADSEPRLPPAQLPQPPALWAGRIPSLAEYSARLAPDHRLVLMEFQRRFPGIDPTESQDFAAALLQERETYGEELTEQNAARFHAWLEKNEAMQAALVVARAQHTGIQVGGKDLNGRGFTLIGFEEAKPRYSVTQNANAAISTGVNLVRMNAAFDPELGTSVDGTGLYVNVNDHGTIYDENPEFHLPANGGTRIIFKEINDAGDRSHMTHVAGTVGGWGYTANLMGMAPRIWMRSLIQQSTSDITGYGMLWPGQLHSTTNPRTGEPEQKSVMGTTSLGLTDTNTSRGVYTSTAAFFDSTLRDYPYYIHFYAASNDGSNYATLGTDSPVSKNVITIGSVSDTVRDSSGNYVSGGNVSGFSSRGPTFDGRIKPDLTANGEGLTSPSSATGSGSKSGTSMATPNASGSTTLLISYINQKLPGHFFRSSTLKALMVNTATDRGNAGPDYFYGWGIINIKAAAEIVKRYAENPVTRVVLEDKLASSQTWTQSYTYDGTGPIRVTLSWLDPAGTSQSTSTTDRTPRLVNNLNLRVIQGGTTYQPYVMPFVLNGYNTADYSAVATTGDNTTDNTEQVYIAAPTPGTYTLQVTHSGSLQNGTAQPFSLAVSGMSATAAITPAVTTISPTTGDASDNFSLTINGSGFLLGSNVFLRRAGSQDEPCYGVIVTSGQITCRVDTAALVKGYWDVVVRAPNGTEAKLSNAFLLPLSGGSGNRSNLYTNTFENGSSGLTLGTGWSLAVPNKASVSGPATAQQGSNALVAYAGSEYPGSVTSYATLPSISTIGYTAVQLEIQRWLGIRKQGSSTDYARVQYSLNGTSWTDVTSHSNLIETRWAAQTYTLPAAAEGKAAVYLRFSLETDATNHSFGWCIDDLKVTGAMSATLPPIFTSTPVTNATAGSAYSYSVTTSDADTAGAALTFGSSGLPAGLSLTPNGSGGATLSGTPTVSGVYDVTLSVADGSYTTYQEFELLVFPAGGNSAPVITTNSLNEGFVGEAYSSTIQATDANGHSLTLSAGSKPTWLTFTDNGNGTATLGGTPPLGGNGSFDIIFSAFDDFQTTQKQLTLVVNPRATIAFNPTAVTAGEVTSNVTLTVQRTDGNYGPVTVNYTTASGSATAGQDFVTTSGTLSWASGDMTSRSILVPITDDATSETDETFTVNLSGLTGIASLGAASATVTIDDNENNALVSVAVTDPDCTEASSGDGSFTFTRTGPTTAAMTVNYSISGTATNGTDYQSRTGTLTISAGSATGTVTIDPIDDTTYEGDETVTLTVEPAVAYNLGDPASATLTLTENDKPTVSIAASATTIQEDAGSVTLTFARTGTTELGPLTVNYAVTGTASSGADYTNIGGSVTIPVFEANRTVVLPILNDALIEGAETIIVTVSAHASYNVAASPNNAVTINLRDDNEPIVLTMGTSDNSASEPAKGDGNGGFRITRLGDVSSELTVQLAPPTGSATSGSDYSALPSSVTLPAGSVTVDIPFTVLDDSTAEVDETIILALRGGTGYTVGNTSTGTVNLYDDEAPQVRLEVGDSKCIEQGTADAGTFTFRRLGLRTNALSVNYTIAGFATNGTDYAAISSPITITANSGSATLTITPINDSSVEGPETVVLTLASGTGYAVAAAPENTATLDIREDETTDVTVAVQDAACVEGNTADAGSFRLTRSPVSASALTVNYTITGTATNGTDYTVLSGTATIAANATTVDIPVTPLNDDVGEGDESVLLTLAFSGTTYDLGDGRSATLWIRDDEVPTMTLTAPDASAAEADGGEVNNGQWTFTASSAPASNLILNYTVSGGTNGADYTALPGTLILPAGQTSVNLDLVPLEDELVEGAETIALTLLPSPNYAISASTAGAVNVIIAASDLPAVRVYAAIPEASENPTVAGQFRIESDKFFTGNTNVLYLMSGTATNGTDYASLTGSVQISAGGNSATLSVAPTNDTDSEGPETVLCTITDAAAYTIAPGGRVATVAIADDEVDGSVNLVVSTPALTVPEGSTASFTVALSSAPSGNVTVNTSAALGGDADLTITTGASLTFTSTNWSTPQGVTLAAAADPDSLAGSATFLVGATGYPTVRVEATESDAQAPPSIRLVSPEIAPLALADITDHLELIAEATDTVGLPTVTWSQVSGPASAVFANTASAATSVSFPSTGTYTLRATATDADTQTATLDLTVLAGSTGSAYSSTTLGATNYSSTTQFGVGTVSLTGTGGDIAGSADSGTFLTAATSGNFVLTARLASLTAVETGYTLNTAAKAGLVLRENTAAGSKFGFEGMTAANGSSFLYRNTVNNALSISSTTGLSLPMWLRLERTGNSIKAFRSTDGTTWTQQGSTQTITMTDPIRVGFAIASGNINSSQPVATFDNISGLPAFNTAPQVHPGTAPEAEEGIAAALTGTVNDDGQPVGNALSSVWTLVSGPGTVAFADPNSPTTTATFSAAGTYQLRLTATDGPATVFDTLQVEVTSTANFASWIGTQSGVGTQTAPGDDPDADGLPNLLEYALGGEAGTRNSGLLPAPETMEVSGSNYLVLSIDKNPLASGVSFVVEVSSDLLTWTSGVGNTFIVSETAETLVVRDATALGSGTQRRFIRLKVVQP